MKCPRSFLFVLTPGLLTMVLLVGCSGSGGSGGNPTVPWEESPVRAAMWFGDTYTIFGDPPLLPAADVDLATVVYGAAGGGPPGDVAILSGATMWVVAVGIEDPPDPDPPADPIPSYLLHRGLFFCVPNGLASKKWPTMYARGRESGYNAVLTA